MRITFAGLSEAGSREENQDCIFCGSGDKNSVFLVADGMGGHQDGAFASRLIKAEVIKVWSHLKDNGSSEETGQCRQPGSMEETAAKEKTDPGELLALSLEEANSLIRSKLPEGSVCGSTAVILSIQQNRFQLVSCGDSHLYLVRRMLFGCKTQLLSVDDVWENEPSNVSGMDPEQIQSHRYYGRLLRAVGTQEKFRYHRSGGKVKHGSLFVLASDGIYKYIQPEVFEKQLRLALKQALKSHGTKLMEQAQLLRDMVYEAGAPDNLSVILVYAERG